MFQHFPNPCWHIHNPWKALKSQVLMSQKSNKIEKPWRDVAFPGVIRFSSSVPPRLWRNRHRDLRLGEVGVAMAIDNEVPAENAQRLPFEFTNLSSNVQTTKNIFVADSLSSISAEVSATMIKNQHKHIQNDIKTPNAHPSNHPNDHHPQTQMFTKLYGFVWK